jgi:hypothetical protein
MTILRGSFVELKHTEDRRLSHSLQAELLIAQELAPLTTTKVALSN